MASTYLTKQISTAGSRKKATISLWVKRGSGFGNDQRWFSYENTSVSNNVTVFKFSGDSIQFADQTGGSNNARYDGTRKLRDPNAWYHFLVKMDTTQATNTDRLKVYINGELQSEASYTYPSQNADLNIGHNSNAYIDIGRWRSSNNQYFDGCMTHFHYTDGYAYDASTFGETDSTSGIWKPKTNPSVTYGTNGFFLKFANSASLGLDSSGNTNNLTVSGTGTQTQDAPSNNFATMNPLRPNNISQTYSNGNNTFIRTGTGGQMNGTLGVTSGKWYYECLIDDYWQYLGWTVLSQNTSETAACSNSGSGFYGLYSNATDALTYANGTQTSQSSYTAMASGQIWGIAFDADNAKMYFSVNGVWENSSDPANQTNPAISSIPVTDFLVPAIGQGTGSRSSTIKINFGNGYFGTTAVTSSNSDGNGYGLFEYSVPSGYYALCTKNIKLYGG